MPEEVSMHARQLSFFEQVDERDSPHDIASEQPETYKGIYAMHKYWSKKPHNLVAHYIQRFSEPGEIVLDAFCGSGVTVIESIRLNRRAIGIDINPVAILSTRMGLQHIDIVALKNGFDFLRREAREEINKLYVTTCPHCGNPDALATHIIWKGTEPEEVWVSCALCGSKKGIKIPSENDQKSALVPPIPPVWYPTVELIENSRINAKLGTRISDLFTPRALSGLSLLLQKIRQIEQEKVRATMEFCFSAALSQASNTVFVIRRRGKMNGSNGNGKAEVGSWVIGYWTPPEHFEINAWRCFENRFRRIVKGKQQVNDVIPSVAQECVSFGELADSQYGYWLNTGTATRLRIPDESVDYVFVDPPHGNRIPYLELSLVWNAWLGLDCDWDEEIIISEAKKRQKGIEDYQARLETAFGELARVLKPGKHISVAFNSLDDDTWLSLLNTCLQAGFQITEISPLEYSARSVVQDTRRHALKTDFVITCQKRISRQGGRIAFSHSHTELEESVLGYVSPRSNGAETYEILNHLLVSGIPKGTIFKVSHIIEAIQRTCVFQDGRWHSKLS